MVLVSGNRSVGQVLKDWQVYVNSGVCCVNSNTSANLILYFVMI